MTYHDSYYFHHYYPSTSCLLPVHRYYDYDHDYLSTSCLLPTYYLLSVVNTVYYFLLYARKTARSLWRATKALVATTKAPCSPARRTVQLQELHVQSQGPHLVRQAIKLRLQAIEPGVHPQAQRRNV